MDKGSGEKPSNGQGPVSYTHLFLESFQEKGMTLITKDEIDIESFKEAIIPQLLEENKDVYPEGAYEQIQALNQ